MEEQSIPGEARKSPLTFKELVQSTHPGLPLSSVADIDRFVISRHFDKKDPRLFSKAGLYRAVEASVVRPDSRYFELPDPESRTDEVTRTTTTGLSNMLDRHKTLYLKNATGSAGWGMVKMIVGEKTLTLKIPRKEDVDNILRRANARTRMSTDEVIILYGSADAITAPLNWPGINQSLEEVLTYLVKYGFDAGEYIAEAPIKIPQYKGRTWEIRNIVQCPVGVPKIIARFAKVGAGEDFSNIMLGGEAEIPEEVVKKILKGRGGSTDVEGSVREYMESNKRVAMQTAEALNDYMRNLARQDFNPADAEMFYAREFSADITGEFDDRGELRPILGEVQYPMRPEVSYIPELEKVDPEGLKRIKETQREIREFDRLALEKLDR